MTKTLTGYDNYGLCQDFITNIS